MRHHNEEIDRSKVIAQSARRRLEDALAEFKRQAFGDEEYHQEKLRVATMEAEARYDAPPEKRHRRSRLYGWNKLMRRR